MVDCRGQDALEAWTDDPYPRPRSAARSSGRSAPGRTLTHLQSIRGFRRRRRLAPCHPHSRPPRCRRAQREASAAARMSWIRRFRLGCDMWRSRSASRRRGTRASAWSLTSARTSASGWLSAYPVQEDQCGDCDDQPARSHVPAREEPLRQRGIVLEPRDLPPAAVGDDGWNEGYRRRDHGASGSAQIEDVQGGSRCLQAVYPSRAGDSRANACVLRPIRDRSVRPRPKPARARAKIVPRCQIRRRELIA